MDKFTLTITKKKTILDNLASVETVDIDLLNELINSDLLKDWDKDNECIFKYDNDKQQLEAYKKKYLKMKKIVKVKYIKSKNLGWGRVFPVSSLSYCSMRRELRHTLAKKFYIDIDVVNCHPSILLQICEANNIPCKNLKNYVENRKSIIDELINIYNTNNETIKNLFIRLLYLGKFENWAKDNNLENIKATNFLIDFRAELEFIAYKIINENKELTEDLKKINKTKHSAILSYYLQEYENRILECVYSYLTANKYIEDNFVLCFDGLMIPIDKYNDNLLNLLSEEVYNKLGFKLNFVKKEMNQDYIKDLEEKKQNEIKQQIEDLDETKFKTFDKEYFNELNSYDVKKIYFEKFCCKILYPDTIYIFTDTEKENDKKYINIIRENELFNKYKHLKYYEIELVGKEYITKEKEFIKKWANDKDIRIFNRCDFMPINEVNIIQKGTIYNLFNGWDEKVLTKYDKSLYDDLYNNYFKDIGINLCGGNEEHFNYFMCFLAHMIQKPNEKMPVAFIIKGKQGTGKNVFLNTICKILDTENFIVSSNPNDFFGTYAEGFYHKLLVNINECEGKDTFDFEGRIKSFITEETIEINPKGVRPFRVSNLSRLIVFTNKANPIPIDVRTKDRRYIVFETTDKYLDPKYKKEDKNKKTMWGKMIEKFNKPEFIAYLYNLLNNIDLSNWNFNNRPITKAYLDMCKLYIPTECLYFESLITEQKYIGDSVVDATLTKEFNKNIGYDKLVKIKAFDLYKNYIKWVKDNGFIKDDSNISIKKFYSIIKDLKIPFEEKINDGYKVFKFIPKQIYEHLYKNQWCMTDIDGFIIDEEPITEPEENDDLDRY